MVVRYEAAWSKDAPNITQSIIHRLTHKDARGFWRVRGDNNPAEDRYVVTGANYMGIVVGANVDLYHPYGVVTKELALPVGVIPTARQK